MSIDFRFYGITDGSAKTSEDFLSHLAVCIRQGVRAIQIREKSLSPRELEFLARSLSGLPGRRHVRVFLNDRADLVVALDLDGVHLTESSMTVEAARRVIGPDRLIGVSVHDLAGLQRAETAGADFVVCGPLATTSSKPAGHPVLSFDEFAGLCRAVAIPVFALGGVDLGNAARCTEAGAAGVAGISLLMNRQDLIVRLQKLENILGHL